MVYVLRCPEPHIAFIAWRSVAHCASPTSLSQSSDIITYAVHYGQHMTRTRKWFLGSRGVSYMGEGGGGIRVDTTALWGIFFYDYISYYLFSLSLLVIIFLFHST